MTHEPKGKAGELMAVTMAKRLSYFGNRDGVKLICENWKTQGVPEATPEQFKAAAIKALDEMSEEEEMDLNKRMWTSAVAFAQALMAVKKGERIN